MGLQNYNVGTGCDCGWNWSLTKDCGTPCPCPDFTIKRHDTRPPLRVQVKDDGTIDWDDERLVVEANIWYEARIKAAVAAGDGQFFLADNVGFEQMLPGDIVVVGGPRSPEMMLVTGFDEDAKAVQVQRAYHGTTARAFAKGTKLVVFRAMNAPATIETTYEDELKEDGTTKEDAISTTCLTYQWQASDTCLPGCFMVEFKLMRMAEQLVEGTEDRRRDRRNDSNDPYRDDDLYPDNVPGGGANWDYVDEDAGDEWDGAYQFRRDRHEVPSGIVVPSEVTVPSAVAAQYGCVNGLGVEWVRRFPVDKPAFVIVVTHSPTTET